MNGHTAMAEIPPPVLDEICQAIGVELARKFFAVFEGTTVTFTKRRCGPTFEAVTRVLGLDATNRLFDSFSGKVYIPRNVAGERELRNLEIRARRSAGESIHALARAYQTTEINIRRIVKASL